MSALQTYYKDNGSLPTTLPTIATQICTNYGSNCVSKHLVDLGFLTTAGDYIEGVPQDPLGGKGLWGSGFYIARLPDGTVQITAPEAEAGKAVQDTAQL